MCYSRYEDTFRTSVIAAATTSSFPRIGIRKLSLMMQAVKHREL